MTETMPNAAETPPSLFRNRAYLRLFLAQVLALSGTGLSTIALALLAYELAGPEAGAVLGTALALKMAAYVFIAPAAGGLAHRLPRRQTMVAMDLLRAGLVLMLPLVESIWQILLLIFLINACSAVFKPLYQAAIPDILPDEAHYTKALALFRIAYDMENILSPALAALLLTMMTFDVLFVANGGLFLVSALLILSTRLPPSQLSDRPMEGGLNNLLFGVRAYLATPRLRGLLSLYIAVAAASAMMIVNTVLYVRDRLGGTDVETAQAMLAGGAGSALAAFLLPGLLKRLPDRPVMLVGGALLAAGLLLGGLEPGFAGLLALWFFLGVGLSLTQTPSGRLVTASCRPGDRTALFAANFSLSHGCWFFAYLGAGWLGAGFGLIPAFLILGAIAALATLATLRIWPPEPAGETVLEHHHPAVEHGHPHLHDEHHSHNHAPEDEPADPDTPHVHKHRHEEQRHHHSFVIDLHHPHWPD